MERLTLGSKHEEQIRCGVCQSFIVASQLRNHIRLVHTDQGQEECKIRSERFGRHGRKKVYFNGLGNNARSWW